MKLRSRWLQMTIGAAAWLLLASAAGVLAAAEDTTRFAPFQFGGEEGRDVPFLLEADQTRYDEAIDTVIAEGSVRITREGRILTADRVEYRITDKILAAQGNITLVEPTGEVLFADELELTDDLDQGYAVAPRILLPDGTRIAAAGTSRISKDRVEVRRAVFSPCNLCPSDPRRAPLWQLRANKITHSDTRQEIEFEGATLDVYGVPIVWIPYLSQPDPRVNRKTGLLAPTFGRDDYLGFTAEIPFFWNIAPNRDLTIEPRFFTKKAPIMLGAYRHLFSFGQTEIEASGGVVEREKDDGQTSNELRGHLRWRGGASLTEEWRTSFQYYRSADDTYLRTFDIDDAGVLRSFATTEGFYRNTYVNATAFTVQEQRTDFDDDDTPTALPFVTADYSAPLGFGGLNLTGQLAGHVLFRPDDGNSQHGTARIGLNRHLNLDGHLLTGDVELRGDLFYSEIADDVGSRIAPRATVDWGYPLFRPLGGGTITLTPRAMATATVGGLNTGNLPNEDSQSLEFDSTALFRPYLADGRDRFDDGQRVDYGVEAAYDVGTIRLTGVVGQSFRTNSSRSFGEGTGLSDSLSDVVLGFGVQAGDWLDGYQRFRWDVSDGGVGATESGLRLSTDRVQLGLQHAYFQERRFDGQTLTNTHQISGSLRLQLDDNWAILGRHRHDLDRGNNLRTSAGLSYADECFGFQIIGTRDRTRTSEVGPNDTVMFRIVLRHLGAASGRQTLTER